MPTLQYTVQKNEFSAPNELAIIPKSTKKIKMPHKAIGNKKPNRIKNSLVLIITDLNIKINLVTLSRPSNNLQPILC